MNNWGNEEDGLILECCAGLDIYFTPSKLSFSFGIHRETV